CSTSGSAVVIDARWPSRASTTPLIWSVPSPSTFSDTPMCRSSDGSPTLVSRLPRSSNAASRLKPFAPKLDSRSVDRVTVRSPPYHQPGPHDAAGARQVLADQPGRATRRRLAVLVQHDVAVDVNDEGGLPGAGERPF